MHLAVLRRLPCLNWVGFMLRSSSYDGFVELFVELWSVTQGTEYESRFSNVMNEAVLRLETQVVRVVCA